MLGRLGACIPQTAKTHAALIASTFIFAGWVIISKIANHQAHPVTFVAMRAGPTSILLFLVAFFWETKRSLRAFVPDTKKEYIRLVILVLLSAVAFFTFQLALKFGSAHFCSLFSPVSPCMATAISIIFKIEKFSWLKIVGVAFAAGGAAIIATQNEIQKALGWESQEFAEGQAWDNARAAMLMIADNVAYGFYVAMQKTMLKTIPNSAMNFWIFLLTAAIALVWMNFVDNPVPPAEWTYSMYLAATYGFLIAGVSGYFLITYATAHTLPTVVGSYITLQPPGAIIMAVLILHETLETLTLVGGGVILIGIGTVLYGKYREGKAEEAAGGAHKPLAGSEFEVDDKAELFTRSSEAEDDDERLLMDDDAPPAINDSDGLALLTDRRSSHRSSASERDRF